MQTVTPSCPRIVLLGLGLATASFAQTASEAVAPREDDPVQLETVKVTAATRTEKLASTLPMTTSVLSREALDRQFSISSDLGTALSYSIPGYAPSRQKLSSRGESFRGRDPLYLVDGIPQSNPLRAGNRESLTIDPFFLQRIEAVHGSSAAQGMGATGGLINFVTRAAPESDGVSSEVEVSGVTSARFKADGYGGKTAALTSVRQGAFGLVAGAAIEYTPMAFDGDGRTLGVDNTQGETLDSRNYSFFFKGTYDLSARHRLELMINHYDLAQRLRWVAVNGNRALGLPTTSARGQSAGLPAENDVTSAALTFTDRELGGGELTLNLFWQDFAATYGAADTAANRTFFRINGQPLLDQSQVVADKRGLRTTWVRTFPAAGNLGLVTGFDYLEDETAQLLVLTGRTWVPYTTYEGLSPYAQLEKAWGKLNLTGGLRYEFARLAVDDFTTIESSGSTFVAGGKPTFEEPLFNLGATVQLTPRTQVFASYAQGFGMADIGRILRAINTPGLDVDSFINLEPIVTDNWETGVRWSGQGWRTGASVYLSTAKLGARLVTNAAGIYDVVRERSETYGAELTGEVVLPRRWGSLGGYATWLEGKSDRDLNGSVDRRLPGVNISAPKVAVYWDKPWARHFSTRLQSMTLLPRKDPDKIAAGNFPGYTLFDLLAQWKPVAGQTVSFGVENLLDRDYLSYFSQTLTGTSATAANAFAGRGRTLTVKYRWEF